MKTARTYTIFPDGDISLSQEGDDEIEGVKLATGLPQAKQFACEALERKRRYIEELKAKDIQ